VSHEKRPQTIKRTLEKERTPEELEKAQEDIGYVILQTCGAHRIFYETIVPVLKKTVSMRRFSYYTMLRLNLSCCSYNEFFKGLPVHSKLTIRLH
jgi:hypothetical protein